jgi:hypothetical protein
MSTLVRALLMVILSSAFTAASGYGAQAANEKVCTMDEGIRAESETDQLNDWDAVYRYFKAYGHCDNGAASEGSADAIIRLLVSDWKHLDTFARLAASDTVFEKFVLNHIDELASQEELRTIEKNAKSLCPLGETPLCTRIEARVSSVLSNVNPFLGVLEDVPARDAQRPEFRAVRVLFQKNGDEWKPFRSDCRDADCIVATAAQYPRDMTWTIAFDGKNVGQITTQGAVEYKLSAGVGLQEITSASSVPTIGKRSKNYSGFPEVEVYRPLVAVSEANFTDPEGWKPTKLSLEIIGALRLQFRSKFPNVSNCTDPDENALKPWLYRDDDIAIEKAYSSRKRWFVAAMKLAEYRCDGPIEGGGPFDVQWYVIDPSGTVRFLDTGLWLVDAGDYDRDGKSELLFAIDRYDVGGYELFYAEFKKRAIFQFGYR